MMPWAAAAVLAAGMAAAQYGWGAAQSGPTLMQNVKQDFEAGRYESVMDRLSPEAMQRLRGINLRKAYLYLGESCAKTGHSDKALGVYQLGTRLFPKDIELFVHRAMLLHASGLDEQAQPLYEKILRLQPANAQAHLGLAEIDHALGFLDRSAQHYELVLEDMAERADLWRDYAEVLYEQRDWLTAELAVRKALALSLDADSVVELALILRAQGRLPEALDAIEPLARSGRRDAARARALWLLEAQRFDEARQSAEDLLRDSPRDSLALYIRARIHWQQGRKDQALQDLEAARAGKDAVFVSRVCAELAAILK